MFNPKDHTILFVDDEENILSSLYRLFRREGYNILTATSGKDGLKQFENNIISLVISDHRMPEMEGVDFLARVKEVSPDIIRIMLTGYADMKATIAAINKGEVSRYITKPWNDDELKILVRDNLERFALRKENNRLNEITQKQNLELKDLNQNLERKVIDRTKKIRDNLFSFVKTCVDLLELYDPFIGGHSKNVAALAKGLAIKMNIEPNDVELIYTAALLHDIGLIGIPRHVIDKGEIELRREGVSLIKQHPIVGQAIIGSMDYLKQVGVLIRSHHEEYIGSGYPDGLKKEEIPLGSRIIAVCDVYDTLSHSKGLYGRNAVSMPATDYIKNGRGVMFDPEIVNSFLEFAGAVSEIEKQKGVAAINLSDIAEGMALARDLTTGSGRLLVGKGTVITKVILERIVNLHCIDPIIERVYIERE